MSTMEESICPIVCLTPSKQQLYSYSLATSGTAGLPHSGFPHMLNGVSGFVEAVI